MEIINENVRHECFGVGVVVEQSDSWIFVQFANGELKQFVYPDAFDKFLTAENEAVHKKILSEIVKPASINTGELLGDPISENEYASTLSNNCVWRVGDTWQGKSYADMINKVLHTDYKAWLKATVPLDNHGFPGVVAWFVFMDGGARGSRDCQWKNYLLDGGNIIKEQFASPKMENFRDRMAKEGSFPKRAAFQRDPDGRGNSYKCKFVGYFEMEVFDMDNGIRIHKRKAEFIY